ncbi:DUF3515 domain-containing protein [Gordonia sp. HY442]|uniref:DUF3515 domain-containing protein n=1 Tax=Gordonia zhenghanii TaxID=2911516 RepID=UPI001F3080A1|nr:DUF3515 domain-containing protein [Gordonia zhenghanii]MCF8606968.1 DUF3515 domain-containing protein [Gordonia zhenghanii]
MAESSDDEQRSPLSPALIATLVAVPVMVIAVFIAFAAVKYSNRPDTESIPVDGYSTAQGEGSEKCAAFVDALPDRLGDFDEKTVDGDTARWSRDGSDPIVVRCGVSRPDELAPTSALQVIDPVQWFMTDTVQGRGQAYVSVDHRPYIAMWVPAGSGNAPITDVSALVAQRLDRAPLDFGK